MLLTLKLKTVLKVLFALISVNKDLEHKLSLREKEVLSGKFLSAVFGSNSLKMPAFFDKNF